MTSGLAGGLLALQPGPSVHIVPVRDGPRDQVAGRRIRGACGKPQTAHPMWGQRYRPQSPLPRPLSLRRGEKKRPPNLPGTASDQLRNPTDCLLIARGRASPAGFKRRHGVMQIGNLTIDPLAVGALAGFGSLLVIMIILIVWIWRKAGKGPGEV